MEEISLENPDLKSEPNVKIKVDESIRPKPILKRNYSEESSDIGIIGKNYAANRNVAEGMMDLALLTANANQLRFLLMYGSMSATFYISIGLIILSLVLQVAVGIALIFRRRSCNKCRMMRMNQFLVGGVFMVTFINILIAAFTTTDAMEK